MSDNRDLSFYDQMTKHQLESVLRMDFEAPDGSGLDMETLLYVMELYCQQAVKPPKTASEAYAVFLRRYLQPDLQEESQSMIAVRKRQFKRKHWRAVTAAVAVLALTLGIGTVVNSRKTTSWEPVYRQNRDYLMVSGNYSHEPTKEVPEVAQHWYPQWLPEGYERQRELRNNGQYRSFYQHCDQGECDTLNIDFSALSAGQTIKYFKNPEPAERFEHDGVVFYLYNNLQRNCAVGCLKGIVICVEGQISREELLRILKSMSLQ